MSERHEPSISRWTKAGDATKLPHLVCTCFKCR